METAHTAFPPTADPHPNAWARRLNWGLLSLTCLALDYLSGPTIQFPFFYLVPVSLAAWYDGRAWGLLLAVALPLLRFSLRVVWDTPLTFWASTANAGIRIIVFVAFAWLISRTAEQMRRLRHIRQMEAILGVCGVCRKIRNQDVDSWQPLDQYLSSRKQPFDRGLCPACRQEFGETFDRR